MSDANFLGTLSITGKCGTAELTKLVQDYKELEALREVEKAARKVANSYCIACGDEECCREMACIEISIVLKKLDEARQG